MVWASHFSYTELDQDSIDITRRFTAMIAGVCSFMHVECAVVAPKWTSTGV